MNSRLFYIVGIGALSFLIGCGEQPRYAESLSPEEALEAFEIEDGFEIALFASEPYISDPIELLFDEDGNAYVVEMGDYPYKPEEGDGLGIIKLVKDTDGDGVIDSAIVFAEGIADATSMMPYDGGLLVAAAPDILYLKDTDGDGKADSTEVLFTGFFENNSEAQITSFRYGVDNWIYMNNNGQRGEVTFTRRPDLAPIPVGGKDFRFRLDRNLFEVESGLGQFGLTLDDWGHRFFTQNTLHLQTAPIPARYLYRHSFMPTYGAVANIYGNDLTAYNISEAPYWRVERSEGRQKQYDEAGLDRVEHVFGHFTGASGGRMYNAGLFPDAYYGNIFTAEVALNLVHRDVIDYTQEGPFLTAKRAPEGVEKEFLASTDPWFRPTSSTVGPDGALYVVDMYRQHIETPVSIPDTLKEDMDFLYGKELGRIYRIYPKGKRPELAKPGLTGKSTSELVDILTHHDQWWRTSAQKLIVERQDVSVIDQVTGLFETHDDPRTRLHALYTLEGLDALSPDLVAAALLDDHGQIRRHGVILAERYPSLLPSVIALADDDEAYVAFQVALSLGQFGQTPEIVGALAKLGAKYGHDAWFRKAILSSHAGSSYAVYDQLQHTDFFEQGDDGHKKFVEELAYVIAARSDVAEHNQLFSTFPVSDEGYEAAIVRGFANGIKKAALDEKQKRNLAADLDRLAVSEVNKPAVESAREALLAKE
ncbi:PVC-type heme-binding CxxCH protein [Parapedobacter sp. 10938]|uniref:PVC-type heme-binding CxxCH protein n=1 Tax=Parapedobacter flavus TaxID=3110225 RepID=UPI002DB5C117|nr:PVC-type heme-binding CxxCH protein [Parapedobacter sp. 10938]MEC3878319.1 PVC-type heme-binding CxxCH protein [Parapedobacter sp. 10938]